MTNDLHDQQLWLTSGNQITEIDPFAVFTQWFETAQKSESRDPNAMMLSSVDADGFPNSRVVLLKKYDQQGFCFFTNFTSQKGEELKATPKAALCFYWKSLDRQVRIQGSVTVVTDKEADDYFASRHPNSQIGAWASDQSSHLKSREAFEKRIERYEQEFQDRQVPRPPHWSGFRLKPKRIEFWQGREFRVHDRVVFTRQNDGDSWSLQRLYP